MGLETVAIAGLAATLVGTGTQVYGQTQQTAATKKAEDLRQQQMEFNQQREQRQIVRKAQAARATAVSNAVGAGAEYGSGLQGGEAQITSDAGAQRVAGRTNLSIGEGLFEANKQLAEAKATSSIGSAVSSLGNTIIQNQAGINRVKSTLFDGQDMTYPPVRGAAYDGWPMDPNSP